MNEVRVTFASAGKAYQAQLTDADGKHLGVAVPLAPFLEDDDYEDLRWYLEDYLDLPDGGAVTRAHRVEQKLGEWGRKLHDALFSAAENRKILQHLLQAAEPRALTIATSDPALLRLPWELMTDEAGPLAHRLSVRRRLEAPEQKTRRATTLPLRVLSLLSRLSQRFQGRRQSDTAENKTPRATKLPLRILYIVSRPADAGFIDPRLTSRALFDALDPIGSNVDVDFCRPPTLARMEELLRDAQRAADPYDLVHFDGHGTFLPDAQIGALLFEKTDDGSGRSTADLVPADRLGDLLASYTIPLVVLEACRSATVGKTAVFRSVAPRLIKAGVGSVLSMGHAVHVEAARLLLDRFYRELVRGTSIGQAVAESRKALVATPGRWVETGPGGRTVELQDWFLPHLYQRAPDDALLPPAAAQAQPVRLFDVFLSHNHNDSARVEALARTLVQKHGLRVWLDRWECKSGKLEPQCEKGIRDSRFTVVVGSQPALKSKWVQWEIDKHNAFNPEGDRLIPIKFESLQLPPELDELLWEDFTDPAMDADSALRLSELVRTADAEDARRRRGFRSPAKTGDSGPFPTPPQYGFHGRARELYDLEGRFLTQRGIVLHAMGGMGKTSLATEAAQWWTRSGLFRDGACFLSFEHFASADRAVQVIGTYLEGPKFQHLPAVEQRRRVIEIFQQNAVLVVWDNFESSLPQFGDKAGARRSAYDDDERSRLADLFRDLTTGPGKGCLLVTCRPEDAGLPGGERYELQGLARADSLWLVSKILKRHGLALSNPRLSRDALDPLLDDLQDHPLSLELVGPHLRTLTPEAIRKDFGKLLAKFRQAAPEERNQSLLASLEFSLRHLSPAAQKALPWLGLFSGGVFEDILLDVGHMTPELWEPIRRELQGIALVRVEDEIEIGGRPFLRFHPTLASAAADRGLIEKPAIRTRYIEVYVELGQALTKAFSGSQSRAALAILDRDEANYRTAVHWAVADQQLETETVAILGQTLWLYLESSGRLRERDAWVEWLREAVGKKDFTKESATYEREHAWTLFTQGDPEGAVAQLEALIERLHHTTEFDPAFQLAATLRALGRVLYNAGASTQAIPVLRDAIARGEALVEREGGQPWEVLLQLPAQAEAATELNNLASTMGDLANALLMTGQHEDALAVSEMSLGIKTKLGNQRDIASNHDRCASILSAMGRLDEADARYEMALAATREAGDKALEGSILQHQGRLAAERNQLDRATHLYQQAVQFSERAEDHGSMMRTYNLLGVTEEKAGRLSEALAWYEKSRELAVQLNDQPGLAQTAQNIGIVWQWKGDESRALGDEPAARRHFEEARRSIGESLRIERSLGNKPGEAASLTQLAQIDLRLGAVVAAEGSAGEACHIRESLGLKEVWRDYHTLSEIAQARSETAAAAEWARKRDAKLAELEGRAGGGRLTADGLKTLQTLTLTCAEAGFGDGKLGPKEENALAQIDQLPAPFPSFAAFLRELAAGNLPPVPTGLPFELAQFLERLAQRIREAGAG